MSFRVEVRLQLDQQLEHGQVATLHRHEQGRGAQVQLGYLGRCSVLGQQAHTLDVVVVGGDKDGGRVLCVVVVPVVVGAVSD